MTNLVVHSDLYAQILLAKTNITALNYIYCFLLKDVMLFTEYMTKRNTFSLPVKKTNAHVSRSPSYLQPYGL